jgi:hypothetical protein
MPEAREGRNGYLLAGSQVPGESPEFRPTWVLISCTNVGLLVGLIRLRPMSPQASIERQHWRLING